MRRIICAILIFCFTLALIPQEGLAKSTKKPSSTAENPKYAAIITDAATGEVLFERNSTKSLHPASLTKVMTLMLLFEALESGTVRLSDKIPISQYAASQQPSKLGLTPGSAIRVEDAILAVVTKSANDIATAIGEYLAGSESRFAAKMTRRAQDIGMTRTNFVNASGLHHPNQVSTARDMAILARYIIHRYPNYYRYFSTKQFTYRGKTMTNHNRLMNTYPGMDGFKTGFINASGYNLIASAKRGDRRLIGVVFGGRTWKSRNDHMAALLDKSFGTKPGMAYAEKQDMTTKTASISAPPVPPQKPVLPQTQNAAPENFTSLSSLGEGRRVSLDQKIQELAAQEQAKVDVAQQAAANVRAAVNRGDYSELTGEGDYDAVTSRRVEAGLLAAAVYKGEHEKIRQLQEQQEPQAGYEAASVAPSENVAASDLWSIQIGAYTSRVATDDALRIAHNRLPLHLRHASPIVVPLNTAQGAMFRGRLGNLSKEQAVEACHYFRDCLPIAPR